VPPRGHISLIFHENQGCRGYFYRKIHCPSIHQSSKDMGLFEDDNLTTHLEKIVTILKAKLLDLI